MWSSEVESEGTFWVFLPRIKLSKPGLSAKIYKQRMWMFFFGHSSWKRTILWSTSRSVCNFHMGNINPKIHKSKVATTKRARDCKGKETYTASKDLESSQTSGCNSVILEQGSQFQAAFAAKAQAVHSSIRRCCGARNSLAPQDQADDPGCCLACMHPDPARTHFWLGSFVLVACEALEVDCSRSLCDAIGSMSSCDSWPDANLMQAFAYVRNSKLLEVPPSFRHLLPHSSESGCCR